jgi:hypothetical protein
MTRLGCGRLHDWSSRSTNTSFAARQPSLEEVEQELQKTHRDDL